MLGQVGEGEMTAEQRYLTSQLPTAQASYEEVRVGNEFFFGGNV